MHKVLIVDDDPIAKKLFSLYIQGSSDFEVSDVIESAAMAESFCMCNSVNLVLMDICTAGHASGLEAACKIKKSMPDIKIIIVTSQPEVDFVKRAREGNVDSFWYKSTEELELLDIMKKTMAGEKIYPDYKPSVQLGLALDSELTELQIKILRELTEGDPTKVIAKRLNISERTVDNNIGMMLVKTGFTTRTKLACAAVDSGIVIKDI